MTLRLAILCSGQGAQHGGMFDLARTAPGIAAQIDAWQLPAEHDFFTNRNAQPLIVGAACAIWQALHARLPCPHIVAGYSVGELAALSVAGIITAAEAVILAKKRAGLMDACVDPIHPHGLAAVSALSQPELRRILANAGSLSPCYIAIENGADQTIVGGFSAALDGLAAQVEAAGGRIQRLPVSVASHTPLMAAAVVPLQEALTSLQPSAPGMHLLAGVSGAIAVDGAAALRNLLAQTTTTVRWSTCMDAIAESSATVALELGPGVGLARMLSARHPRISCRAVDDFRSIDGIVGWIARSGD